MTSEIVFHVYAICNNEHQLLPKFFYHYREADRIFILDNEPSDDSINIVKKYKRDIIQFSTDDNAHQRLKNTIWKLSKYNCDYVIVQDLNEFVIFPSSPSSIKKGLYDMKIKRKSWAICLGYEMLCSDEIFNHVPDTREIFEYIQTGYRCRSYDKPLFSPNYIFESNFTGQCDWNITYNDACPIEWKNGDDKSGNILLLCYKHTGQEREFNRRKIIRDRMSKSDFEYMKTDKELKEDISNFYKNSNLLSNIMFKVPMLTCELKGGLGNQLFMISATLAHCKTYGLIPFFQKYTYVFENRNLDRYRNSIFSHVPYQFDINITNFKHYVEHDDQLYQILPRFNSNSILLGYFQTSKYFHEIKQHLYELFKSENSESQNFINKIRTPDNVLVGINVRRKEYVKLKWDLPFSYYDESMKTIKQKYKNPVKFVIVSDDIKWCRNTFPEECIFCDETTDDIVQFDILRNMDAWITSNSTFCWWAVYLGDKNNDKTVYCPFPWCSAYRYNEYIYEPHWIKVKV
jgi:hypothetical protein